MSDDIDLARAVIAGAQRLVIFTGAGVSAESGVPTFRGAGGLWREFRAEELATPDAFARDPRLVWEWYGWRRELVAQCEPNAAHRAIAEYAASHIDSTIVTQNVDGLHQRAAGDRAAGVIALHGNLFSVRCTSCGRRSAHHTPIDALSRQTLPHCDACSALLRPDIVWFGEHLDEHVLDAAFAAARACDACLVVGTSALVQPAASVAMIAVRSGAALVEVNADATPLTSMATISLRGLAGEIVPQVLV